jgi:hypothetical protein
VYSKLLFGVYSNTYQEVVFSDFYSSLSFVFIVDTKMLLQKCSLWVNK